MPDPVKEKRGSFRQLGNCFQKVVSLLVRPTFGEGRRLHFEDLCDTRRDVYDTGQGLPRCFVIVFLDANHDRLEFALHRFLLPKLKVRFVKRDFTVLEGFSRYHRPSDFIISRLTFGTSSDTLS
jgi:hypothetical protein